MSYGQLLNEEKEKPKPYQSSSKVSQKKAAMPRKAISHKSIFHTLLGKPK